MGIIILQKNLLINLILQAINLAVENFLFKSIFKRFDRIALQIVDEVINLDDDIIIENQILMNE